MAVGRAGFGLIRQNSPTSAMISPMMKVVPITTARNFSTGQPEVDEAAIESDGSNERPVTSNPKKTQLVRR